MTRNKATLLIICVLLAILSVSSLLLLIDSVAEKTNNNNQITNRNIHYSTLMGKEFFDKAYEQSPTIVKTDLPIAGGTVNHHLLAAPLDAQFFDGLAAQKPKRIILIGPDHLSRGREPITTTAGVWQTPYGELTTDTALIGDLSKKGIVNIEESPFDYEFSVGGLVPFIKRSLPDAKVTTIIVKINTPEAGLDALAAALPTDKNTAVVGSIDFSHYLPSRAAEFHDLTNRAIINAFDFQNFDKLEIDSPPTLRVLLKYLERRGSQTATLVANTDSAKITGQLDLQEGTSYLNQYFSVGEKTPFEVKTSLYLGYERTPPTPSFPKRGVDKITSPEDRFMRGFMSLDDGSTLPAEFKKPDLAVGIARYAEKTIYYLFPTIVEKGTRRLMTAVEEKAYFRQNNLKESIITKQ